MSVRVCVACQETFQVGGDRKFDRRIYCPECRPGKSEAATASLSGLAEPPVASQSGEPS